ncbi:hypothetical protein LL962_20605 [Xanthomonas sp. NCPPB 1067]|uniref:hypothetical protein n=1 Tax=Xanthomonas sp. NCPPB 1067 TaxID=487524 RepID=UPI001E55A979|nr:hypothetical protein [Xanthomonas sp. NCPPB 1067]MCC4589461.1 hypothetical protein [Xanthomonas sp. NCPPB 1067]
MLTILLMSTLLTASLVVLAYRNTFTILLELAQYAASICALLHFAIVAMLQVTAVKHTAQRTVAA